MSSTRADLHRIPELDGLRGIAVLAVVLFHFNAPWTASRPFGPLTPLVARGNYGVDIFFVLSGYLITSILISTRHTQNYFSAFYARRSLRIFPVYFLAVAAYFWVALPLAHRHGLITTFKASEQWWYWTFLCNWRQVFAPNDGAEVAHFWTLAIEEQFYVFFSIVVAFVSGKNLARLCAGLAVLSIALRVGLAVTGHLPSFPERLTVLHLEPIALGALLACSARVRDLADRWSLALLAIGVVGVFLPLPAYLQITAAALGAGGAVARCCARPMRFLRIAPLQSLGKYSFALYVIHNFFAGIGGHLAKQPRSLPFILGVIAGCSLLSYAAAWVSWRVLEEPILRLKANFPYRVELPEAPEVDRHLISTDR